ncbi:MAG: SEC-C domain-containing protein, partial [Candidatus Gastranaerophilales bacterium]|nr:SEC-C domain-containing protein [Candidatus Gastranaerophilales bacterium]
VVNESLGKDFTLEELIKEYKSDYLKHKLYSSATVLYCSTAFATVFDTISTPQSEKADFSAEKVGRNEPCPCGSGKKFKNCCGK